MMYISDNRYEWSVRRVDEINKEIKERTSQLKNIKGFWARVKTRLHIRKLNKQLFMHGEEVLQYEYNRSHNLR